MNKVKTLNRQLFREACRQLEAKVAGFDPDVVIGIASGGVCVAREMFPMLSHVSVTCRRASSGSKDKASGIFKLIRRLPLWLRDWLRVLEAKTMRARSTDVVVPRETAEIISRAKRILVVDDAVDSGVTLAAVVKALNFDGALATAAITVTTANPVLRPDYSLYETLVRFPWSKDFNERD